MATRVRDIVNAPWAEIDTSVWINLERDWEDILRRYRWLGPSVALDWVFDHVQALGATRAVIEPYIDADYRDEYQQFYTLTFTPPSDRCERLHFWRDRKYLGYSTLRPIPGRPVCRTMLPPRANERASVPCIAHSEARPYGERFDVEGFPFMAQDLQYGRCAHAVIWMISYFHHLRNRCPRAYLSDIVAAAEPHESERLIPSPGLTLTQVGVAFRRLGLPSLRYDVDDLPGKETVESIVCRYVNSRIPLALVYGTHVVAIIGCGRDRNGFYVIVSDDASGAYRRLTPPMGLAATDGGEANKKRWRSLLIPLPGRLYLAGEAVQVFAQHQFSRLLGALPEAMPHTMGERRTPTDERADLPEFPNLQIRTYATHSRAYKTALAKRVLPDHIAFRRAHTVMPRWIWVAELQDATAARNGSESVLGEIIVDATSDALSPVIIDANISSYMVSRNSELIPRDWASRRFRAAPSTFRPYQSGTALSL